eukprot:CAMPEP_0174901234 /NCGR_PEP_ID=MMETSP0167-20121228/33884_1 /TAXON_ID=38298 /ORGANISM="Rhodella maculata, Strain CCMP736" /LENGTH=233 /DNA_ID=CAMNT_0016142859 /DNA_START=40 /DNA_END=741 /DNA_ORIENTATION=-
MEQNHRVVFLRSRRKVSCRDGHPALKCNPDGKIQADMWGEAHGWETWKLHVLEDGRVALEAWTGRYLSAAPEGGLYALSESIGDREKFSIENSEGIYVGLKSCFGKYLRCAGNCGEAVKSDRRQIGKREQWAIVNHSKALTNPGEQARKAASFVLLGVGSLLATGAFLVPVLGFGVAGVAAGSAAAVIQSAIYGGATCGVFAALQSAGATLAWVNCAAAGVVVAGVGGVGLRD